MFGPTLKKWNSSREKILARWQWERETVTGRCNFLRAGGSFKAGERGAVRQGRDKSGDISHIVTAIWPHADLHEKSETELKAKIQLI